MKLLKIDSKPSRVTSFFLSWFLFAAGIALYIRTSNIRHAENPEDKVVPGFAQLRQGVTDAFLKPDTEEATPADFENSHQMPCRRHGRRC